MSGKVILGGLNGLSLERKNGEMARRILGNVRLHTYKYIYKLSKIQSKIEWKGKHKVMLAKTGCFTLEHRIPELRDLLYGLTQTHLTSRGSGRKRTFLSSMSCSREFSILEGGGHGNLQIGSPLGRHVDSLSTPFAAGV